LARLELQPVDEDADRDEGCVLSRDPHERQVPIVQVAHGRHERHRADGGAGAAQRFDVAGDLHQPTLKNSRRLFIAPSLPTSSSKSASRWTKLRFSELTVSTGAAS